MTSRFWIKGGQLDLSIGDVTFLDQRRSVGSPYWWRHVFGSEGGQLDPPVGDLTFLDQRTSVGSPCWWRHVFGPQLRPPKSCVCLFVKFYPHHQFLIGCDCLFVTLYPHHQFLKGFVCMFVTFYPHHQFNRAEGRRREARRWEPNSILFKLNGCGLAIQGCSLGGTTNTWEK